MNAQGRINNLILRDTKVIREYRLYQISVMINLIIVIHFRHCLSGTGCDMFQIDSSNANQLKCTYFSNTPIKEMVNLYKYIRYLPQDLSDVQIYILHCSIPQENLIRNSDFYIKTHLRKLRFHKLFFIELYTKIIFYLINS